MNRFSIRLNRGYREHPSGMARSPGVPVLVSLGVILGACCGHHTSAPTVRPHPSPALSDDSLSVDAAVFEPLSAGEWMTFCRTQLNLAAKKLHGPEKPPEAFSPVDYRHVNHHENRLGAEIRGPHYTVNVWLNPPEDLADDTDWEWTSLWYAEDGTELSKRPFGSHTKQSNALGATIDILPPVPQSADERPSPVDRTAVSVESLYKSAVDACLDAGTHLSPSEPFSLHGYGPTDMERFFNRLDESVVPEREYRQPICRTEQFVKATVAPRDTERLPPLAVGGLDPYRLYPPEAREDQKNEIRKYAKAVGTPTLQIVNVETNEISKSITVPSVSWQKDAREDARFNTFGQLEIADAFPEPGRYRIELIWHTNSEARYAAEVEVARGDVAVVLDLWFLNRKDSTNRDERPPLPKGQNPWMLATFTLIRISPPDERVILYRAWTPRPDGMPEYVISNRRNRPIHGVGWLYNFFGRTDRRKNDQWEAYERGGKCGTVSGGSSIPSGQVTSSIEGYYIGPVNPYQPGRYRYVVHYSFSPRETGARTDLVDAGETTYRVEHHFELLDVFNIDAR